MTLNDHLCPFFALLCGVWEPFIGVDVEVNELFEIIDLFVPGCNGFKMN